MPRSVRGSDDDEDVKPGRKTRATTDAVSVDSPLRRSSRINPIAKENESSPESLLSDTSNVSNTQTTRVRTRQKIAMDNPTLEKSRTLRSRINSVSSDVSEVTETDVGIISKKTRNTTSSDTPNKINNRRSSRRLTRAGSEANSPPPVTRVTRSTRASSMGPETNIRQNESDVKIRKRISVLPLEITVIEEKIPVISLDRTLPDMNSTKKVSKDSDFTPVKESNNSLIENTHTSKIEEDPDTSDNMQRLTLSPETEPVKESAHNESPKKDVSLKECRNLSSINSTEHVECAEDENEVEVKHSIEINTTLPEQSKKIHDKENNEETDIKMDISIEEIIDKSKKSENNTITSENVNENNEISEKANTSKNEINEIEISKKTNTSDNEINENKISKNANTSSNEINKKANTSSNEINENEISKNANTTDNEINENEISKKVNTSEIIHEKSDVNKKADISEEISENNEISEKMNTSENIDANNEISNKSNTSENVHEKDEINCTNAISSPNLSNSKLSKSSDKILITDIAYSEQEDIHDLKDTNKTNNSLTATISESSNACTSLKESSTVNNISEGNVLNVVKNSQSFTVTEDSVKFSEEIPENKGQSKKASLDNSIKKESINELNEEKSETNQDKTKNDPENTDIDNDSDINVASLFQDIPAHEWKQKNADSDKNSVHSVSTEKLENESEGECDLVLVDREAWVCSENTKTEKKKETFDYDSDDTVVLKAQKRSIGAVNKEEMIIDTSANKSKLNISKGKNSDTKSRKSIEHKEIENEENVTDQSENVQDDKNTAQNLESSINAEKNKSIVEDNERSTSKCNISNRSKGDKSLSKSYKRIEIKEIVSDENNLSEDIPKKRKSLNKSKQDVKNMSDSDNSESKYVTLRKLFFNAQSDTNSDDDDDESSKSIDSDVQKEYNLYGKDVSKFSDDDVPGDECRASETESSDPDDNGSDLADFVVEEGEESDEDNESQEEDDEVQENEDKDEAESNESDVEAEDNENEIDIEKNDSEAEVEENESEAEAEENESEEEDMEIKNKELNNKESKIKSDNKKRTQKQDEDMEVEAEQNKSYNQQKRNTSTSLKKDKNENSLTDLSHSNVLKTKKKGKIRTSGEFIVEDLEHSLNDSQLVFNKKILKLNTMQCSTPKTNLSKQEVFNTSIETSKANNSEKRKKETSKLQNLSKVTELNSSDKEEKKTPLKEKSLKKLSKTLTEGYIQQNLSPELVTLLTKTNLSRTMSSRVSQLNKTALASESITPTTKHLMKEKLSSTAPVLTLNNTVTIEQDDVLNEIEENKNTSEPNIGTTQDKNDSLKRKIFKVVGNILKTDEQKKHRKPKQSAIESTNLIFPKNEDEVEDEDSDVENKSYHTPAANNNDNDEVEEERVGKKKKKKNKKKAASEEFTEMDQMNNNETVCNTIKIKKKKCDNASSFPSTNEESKIVSKKRKLSTVLSNEGDKIVKKKKKVLNTLSSENEEIKTLKKKKKKKLLNSEENEDKDIKLVKKKKQVLSNENEETKTLKKKKKKVLDAPVSENNETKPLKKKKKKNTSANKEDVKLINNKQNVPCVVPNEIGETKVPKKKKKISDALSNENEETKTLKKKKKLLNPLPNENEETKVLKKKKKTKLLNAAENEDKDIKSIKKKKKKVLSNENGQTKILKKKKKVLSTLQSENEDIETTRKIEETSDNLPSKKSKKKKKLISEDRTSQVEGDLSDENIDRNSVKLTNVTSQQYNDTASDSDEEPQSVGFSEARNEALEMLKHASTSIKASKEIKKKKHMEHLQRMQRQKEMKIKKLESQNQIAKMNQMEPLRSGIKRLSDEDLEKLSSVPILSKKKKFAETEMQSRSMNKSKGKNIKKIFVDDSSSLNSCISTTEFSVVSLETIKKNRKGSEISTFRQKMLARNSRQPVSAYLMYLKKQKASGKDKFCNNI